MGEHNSEQKKAESNIRELLNASADDKEFAEAIAKTRGVTKDVAEMRVLLIKQFCLTHGKKLTNAVLLGVIDLISDGVIVPTNMNCKAEIPLSAYLHYYDAVRSAELEKNPTKKGECGTMEVRIEYLGKKYAVFITGAKEADKAKEAANANGGAK